MEKETLTEEKRYVFRSLWLVKNQQNETSIETKN